jgi:hypothetical protein
MSSIAGEPQAFRRGDWDAPALAARLRRALPLILVTIVAIVLRLFIVTASDVSWLITLSEKVLDGNRLYIDLIEVNPPASILLYLPAVALARLIGVAPEIVVNTLIFLAVGASLWISSRILVRARLLDGVDGWIFVAFAASLLLIFPARAFAQREHIAVIVLLPALAVYVARAQGISPGFAAAIIAGIGTGIAVSIKPHFALAIILAAATAAYHAKSWRLLFAPEHWIAGGIIAIYGASIFVFYPQFISDVLPLVQAIYVPIRQPLSVILTRLPAILWLLSIFLLAIQKQRAILAPRFSILLMASCGFALAHLAQGKGWPYQTYPMLALSLLTLAILPSEHSGKVRKESTPKNSRTARLLVLATTIGFVAVGFNWLTLGPDFTPLAETIQRYATQPRMLVISSDFGLGHPLVRQLRGQWVQRVGSLWITKCAEWMLKREHSPVAAALLESYVARDRAMLLEDIRREKPDIILVDQDWEAYTRSDSALSELLKAYGEVSREQGIIILRRQNREKPAAEAVRL